LLIALVYQRGLPEVPTFRHLSADLRKRKKISLAKLETEQECEVTLQRAWVHHLGQDLSLYVRHTWSSFASLHSCSNEIGVEGYHDKDKKGADNQKEKDRLIVWKEIELLYQSKKYVRWQEAWGGIFVDSLRRLSKRFMCVALYLLRLKERHKLEDRIQMSGICELLGISLYSDIMGSQNYGYPMHEMTQSSKRDLANTAKHCFQAAVDIISHPTENDVTSKPRSTWDVLFMIGKCNEKIAGTYQGEKFHEKTAGGTVQARMYEQYMALAMDNYSRAFSEVIAIESDGTFTVDQQGGSSHGSTEVMYRIHASRLKCLVSAVSHAEEELEVAEAEALRLTESQWFKEPDSVMDSSALHTRDRIWNVLSDVVAGLAQCRLDHNFFHRSVYRYAQALMWSPLLYDPTSCEGSLGTVPATRSYQIRGLNNSTHAAHSAEVIMSSLFDKKRSQLCAVWVTTSVIPSPFQLLNNSTRKYDSLRGKYIAAYLETLRLCHRRSELETFIKWTSTSKRDLPSYFQASALAGGNSPAKPHTHDCLLGVPLSLSLTGFLISVKRQTNSVFADIIIHEMSQNPKRSADNTKAMENHLKQAYACFLRLHCKKEDLKKYRAWKYGSESVKEVDALCQAYLALGEMKDIGAEVGDWSGGARKSAVFDAALIKAQSLFPSLTGTFLIKKPQSRAKKGSDSSEPDTTGGKRKDRDEMSKVSFEVAVPKDLAAGDTFLTTVVVGDVTQKVKLKVPEGNPTNLRFTLQVPNKPAEAKKARVDED